MRHLAATTGEDVVGAFNVLLGEKQGNKVDALQVWSPFPSHQRPPRTPCSLARQTVLRSLLQLHRTAYLTLIEDCRKCSRDIWNPRARAPALPTPLTSGWWWSKTVRALPARGQGAELLEHASK